MAEKTQVNEWYVTVAKIEKWLSEGYTARQIALIWNGGQAVEKKGTNEWGQAYDTGQYADTVLSYLKD